jgi:hypothetical protein
MAATIDAERRWAGPWMFCQLADTQLGMHTNNDGWGEEVALCRRAVARVNQLEPRPKFLVVWQSVTMDRKVIHAPPCIFP